MLRITILAAAALVLSACQTKDYTGDEDSYRYRIPVGSTLTLNQTLTIPGDRSSIYVFRGEVVTYRNVDIYYSHCQFKLKKISKEARKIKPDTFVVTKLVDWEDYQAGKMLHFADAGIYTGANLSGRIVVGAGGDGGPSIKKYATIISLQSNAQPQVKEMVCAYWGSEGDFDFEPLTISQTRKTLGNIFTLNIKSQ